MHFLFAAMYGSICLTFGIVLVIITMSQETSFYYGNHFRRKDMLSKIENNQYTGGAYKRATWIDKVCRNKAERAVLDTLCKKGLAETGLGGTVAGDVYWGCWLTQRGKEAIGIE